MFITKILKSVTKKGSNKNDNPLYTIKDLYVGKIKIKLEYPGAKYFSIKDFAILHKKGKKHEVINKKGLPNEYIVDDIKPFTKKMIYYLNVNHLNANSQLSLKQLIDIERSEFEKADLFEINK